MAINKESYNISMKEKIDLFVNHCKRKSRIIEVKAPTRLYEKRRVRDFSNVGSSYEGIP